MMPPKAELSFVGHLQEIRSRALKCFLLYVAACALCCPWAGDLLSFLMRPAGNLVFLSPPDAFVAYWNVVLCAGLVLVSPYIFFHIWGFISAGLFPDEKRFVRICATLTVLFFLAGAAFAFFVILPLSLQFFMGYATETIRPLITLDRYVAYAAGVVFFSAVAFELPVFLFLLARMNVVDAAWLAEKRKFAVVGILVIAAVLTPPDIVSQLMLAVPVWVLFELGVVLARLGAGKNKKPPVVTEGFLKD